MREKATAGPHRRCPDCLGEQEFPEAWLRSQVRLLPKKDVKSTDPKKWRPVILSKAFIKGVAEMLRQLVLEFVCTSGPNGKPGYVCKNFSLYTLENGAVTIAARSVRLMTERARREKSAVVILLLDLEKAFGSVNVDTVFDSLYRVYHVDPGVAAFLAYTTKFQTRILGKLERVAKVWTPQGSCNTRGYHAKLQPQPKFPLCGFEVAQTKYGTWRARQ